MNHPGKGESARQGFIQAQAITRKYASTFYFASRFLAEDKRLAAYSAYAICRISDESVDSAPAVRKSDHLMMIKRNIDSVYSGAELKDILSLGFKETVNKYNIPKQYFDQLLEDMGMDLNKRRYETFDELYAYCYKVAAVVRLIMLKIFGSDNPQAEKHAVELGIAMQLTNILRDIKKDFAGERIYLPQEEMKEYGVGESNIAEEKISEDFKALLKFQINRARQYY